MNHDQTTDARLRNPIDEMASTLNILSPTVASRGTMPRALVLAIADVYDVELTKGTAEQQLSELIELAGLVDQSGRSLTFTPGRSAEIADPISKQLQAVLSGHRSRSKKERASTLKSDWAPQETTHSKLELVNKISALTHSGPETLGPGSKERKSVLNNLHMGLGFGDPPSVSKSELGGRIARRLGVPWERDCYSTGETLTKIGLSRLYDGAVLHLKGKRQGRHVSASEEASMYSGVILQTLLSSGSKDPLRSPDIWDGYTAVKEMLAARYAHARQTEWPGWYFEFCALPALKRQFNGGPYRVESTTFDYRGLRTWDLKSHSDSAVHTTTDHLLLNDKHSLRTAVAREGIGFAVLRGDPIYEGEENFYTWHSEDVRGRPKEMRSLRSRRLKTGFRLANLEFYFIEDLGSLSELETSGALNDFAQGRQATGEARNVKYKFNLKHPASREICVSGTDVRAYLAETKS